MRRTVQAAILAGVLTMLLVASVGSVLGFPSISSLVTGLVAGVLAGGLIGAVAARSGSHDAPTRPRPRHPGPPDHEEPDV